MSDNCSLFILNQGWCLGIVILCIVLLHAVLKRVTWRGTSYLLWSGIPICYFYIVGVECLDVLYYKSEAKLNNIPLVFWGEKEMLLFKSIWGLVFLGMLLYIGYSFLKIKYITMHSRHFRENIYITERSEIPFTIGVIKPKIYLPEDMQEEFYEPVICHEKVHIARKDYLVKNLAFVLLAINWFQPLMWLAYYLFVKDMEVTCDDMVLRKRSMKFRKQYAKTLLELSTREGRVGFVTTGYGSVALKERVVNISRNQKRRPLQRVLITVMCIVIVLLSIPVYGAVRKPFGYVANATESTNDVWEVRTRIHP